MHLSLSLLSLDKAYTRSLLLIHPRYHDSFLRQRDKPALRRPLRREHRKWAPVGLYFVPKRNKKFRHTPSERLYAMLTKSMAG